MNKSINQLQNYILLYVASKSDRGHDTWHDNKHKNCIKQNDRKVIAKQNEYKIIHRAKMTTQSQLLPFPTTTTDKSMHVSAVLLNHATQAEFTMQLAAQVKNSADSGNSLSQLPVHVLSQSH